MAARWFSACAAASISGTHLAGAATLVENGEPRADIVIPAGTESEPPKELRQYIGQRAKLPIVTADKLDMYHLHPEGEPSVRKSISICRKRCRTPGFASCILYPCG